MRLKDVLPAELPVPDGSENLRVTGVTSDSRQVTPGMVFVAVAGSRADGACFMEDAVARGAVAVVTDSAASPKALQPNARQAGSLVPVVRVPDARRALALAAARYHHGQPAVAVVITGTSGKTSIAEFTRQIFAALGHQAASLGTLGVITGSTAVYGSLTTPDPVTLHQMLAELSADGITHLAFEASSHGLDQRRLDGVAIAAAAFSNLGRDHMDYHATVGDYLAAKLRLFDTLMEPGQPAVINTDGACSDEVAAVARRRGLRVLTVGTRGETLRRTGLENDGFGQRVVIHTKEERFDVLLPLVGAYQAENALVAVGLAMATGADARAAVMAMETLKGVPGRLEIAGRARGGLGIVDYAHKPEALAAALDACRPFATGRLICVFGCGGDRDRGKRPIMGAIAVAKADTVIITDDNPRTEDATAIRAAILARAPGAREIGDRADAIREAVSGIGPGDVVLVAGKGHETGQIVGDSVLPFSDIDVLRQALRDAQS